MPLYGNPILPRLQNLHLCALVDMAIPRALGTGAQSDANIVAKDISIVVNIFAIDPHPVLFRHDTPPSPLMVREIQEFYLVAGT
jgi:hypothetical protein